MAEVINPSANLPFGTHIRQMLESHPGRPLLERSVLQHCIETCFDCAQACVVCADACLQERDVAQLTACVRMNQDCADLCLATGRILSRQTALDPAIARAVLQATITTCRACARECLKHRRHQHCRTCADACARCEQACELAMSR